MGITPHDPSPLQPWNPVDPSANGVFLCPECGIEGVGAVMLAHINDAHRDVAPVYRDAIDATAAARGRLAEDGIIPGPDTGLTANYVHHYVRVELDMRDLDADIAVGDAVWRGDDRDWGLPVALTNVRRREAVGA
jgi:hypothetical protein